MRIVSIVPSLTEAVAVSAPESLVGCTDWCTHPTWLASSGVTRVGGTKNPTVRKIVDLEPDVVLANFEENREVDLAELRAAGVEVMLTDIRDVPSALRELRRVATECEWGHPEWLDAAEQAWWDPDQVTDDLLHAVVPIWRRPWMAVGGDTYAGDVLARLGVLNVLEHEDTRYPRFDPAELMEARAVDIVVLPDEPYKFTATDGPEVFEPVPSSLVDGRALTWYGPAMVEAPQVLLQQLRSAFS